MAEANFHGLRVCQHQSICRWWRHVDIVGALVKSSVTACSITVESHQMASPDGLPKAYVIFPFSLLHRYTEIDTDIFRTMKNLPLLRPFPANSMRIEASFAVYSCFSVCSPQPLPSLQLRYKKEGSLLTCSTKPSAALVTGSD